MSVPTNSSHHLSEASAKFLRPSVEMEPGNTVSISNAKLMFSVDTSNSTRGHVLREEQSVVLSIGAMLTDSARQNASVGPWNGSAEPLLPLKDIDSLSCKRGTDPGAILRDADHVRTVAAADMWFLFTDGQISGHNISAFAERIPYHNLHGKPCVIVVFGDQPLRPVRANISVGISLYSVSPDCIFLFHDVISQECFIFQSKGCFDVLNPRKLSGQDLSQETTWEQLPQLNYKDLNKISIPERHSLKPNEILLQRGISIDFERFLSGQIGANGGDAILDDQDNINTVILTASTRNEHRKVLEWIRQQKIQRGVMLAPRPDIMYAQTLVARTLHLLETTPSDMASLQSVRVKLVSAHQRNWDHVFQSLPATSNQEDERMQVIDDAIERLTSISSHDLEISSPRVLSQISSAAARSSRNSSKSWQEVLRHSRSPTRDSDRSWAFIAKPRDQALHRSGKRLPPIMSAPMAKQMTYVPGYRKSLASERSILNTCVICGMMVRCPALLLKEHPKVSTANDLAFPDNKIENLYPLMLAIYPQIDALSLIISCDSCAFHMAQAKLTYKGERFVGVLPVGIDLSDSVNMETWLDTVDKAFEHRLQRASLPLVMFALTTHKLNELAKTCHQPTEVDIQPVLAQFRDDLLPYCTIHLPTDTKVPITDALAANVEHLSRLLSQPGKTLDETDDLRELLNHPIESFLLLLTYAKQLDTFSQTRYVFIKLSMHMIDGYQRSDIATNIQAAFSGNNQPPIYTMSDLVNIGLIDTKAYEMLQDAGEAWEIITKYCMPAVNHLVFMLGSGAWWTKGKAITVLTQWLMTDSFRKLCLAPWDQGVASALLRALNVDQEMDL